MITDDDGVDQEYIFILRSNTISMNCTFESRMDLIAELLKQFEKHTDCASLTFIVERNKL